MSTEQTDHVVRDRCPGCGHEHVKTVDTRIEGRGATQTLAIRECGACGELWGEPRHFSGVKRDD